MQPLNNKLKMTPNVKEYSKMKQITKFFILTVLALALMGSAAVAFAHDGSANMKRPGGPGRGPGSPP